MDTHLEIIPSLLVKNVADKNKHCKTHNHSIRNLKYNYHLLKKIYFDDYNLFDILFSLWTVGIMFIWKCQLKANISNGE